MPFKESFNDFGNSSFVFAVRYKSVNAQCVAVNAKAIQACLRSEQYWVYEVIAKSVRSQRVKVYAVNPRNILV